MSANRTPLTVLVGGGTGFIGQALVKALRQRGHRAVVVSRRAAPTDADTVTWEDVQAGNLPVFNAAVNLSGENVFNPLRRWNAAFISEVTESRVRPTRMLADAVAARAVPGPHRVFVGLSGVGFYDTQGTFPADESTPGGAGDALSRLCVPWEAASAGAAAQGVRTVTLRMGVVLGRAGGVVQQAYWPFFFGLGTRLGPGTQIFPWIHVADATDLLIFALENSRVTGVLNAVAPTPTTNAEYTTAFASAFAYPRPAFLAVPGILLRAMLGTDRANALVTGIPIVPKHALDLGFTFRFPTISLCMSDVLKQN